MKITVGLLTRKHACREQVERFAELYPAGVEVTEAGCVAVAHVFNWSWAAEKTLPASLYADYEAKLASLFGRLAETI